MLDLKKTKDHELVELIVTAARELVSREEEMAERLIPIAVDDNMAFGYSVLAARYRSDQITAARA